MNDCAWQSNWEQTQRRFTAWWNRQGLVVGTWGAPQRPIPRELTPDPGLPADLRTRYADGTWRAASQHWALARCDYPLEILPLSDIHIGPGSLALLLGSEPEFADTVWYHSTLAHETQPERLPPLKFDPANFWWQVHERTARASAALARGKYLIGCPDLIENIDILASLRGIQQLLTDMVDRPEWVCQKVEEINEVWFEAYQRLYDIIQLSDGSSAFGAFRIWGSGKTAKVQCDASAMFGPDMFARFVVPALSRQCAWLDHSLFHLDGKECLCHLDLLLAIPDLDGIEWTPDPASPSGGDPHWHPLYRKILKAGKCVQALGVRTDQIRPLLDAVGGKGLYIMTDIPDLKTADHVARLVEPYR